MGELNLSTEESKELVEMIEVEAQGYLEDEENAKDSMDILSKSAEDKYGIKKAAFKKIAKAYYQSSIEELTETALQFKRLYIEALGGKEEC